MRISFLKSAIARKFTLFLVSFSVLPLLIIGFVSYKLSTDIIKSQAFDNAQTIVESNRNVLDIKLSMIDNLVANITSNDEVIQALSSTKKSVSSYGRLAIEAQIDQILSSYLNLDGVVSVDIYTQEGASFHVGKSARPSSVWERTKDNLFAETLRSSKSVYWAGVQYNINKNSNYKRVLTASSIISILDLETLEEKPAALLVINFDIDEFTKSVNSLSPEPISYFLILDQKNRFVYHPDNSLTGQVAAASLLKKIELLEANGKSASTESDSIANVAKFERNDWQIIRIVPVEILIEPTNVINYATLVLIVGCLILVLIVGYAFTRKVVSPVAQVTDAFKNYEQGDLKSVREIVTKGNDEFSELAKWFNSFIALSDERRKAKQALEESEAKFRDYTEASSDWFWETDEQHRFKTLSGRFFTLREVDTTAALGRTRHEIFKERMQQEDPALWDSHIADLKAHREFELTYPIVDYEGKDVYIRTNGKPVFDAEGKFLGYRGTGKDVTDAMMAQKELMELNRTLEDRILERTRDLLAEKERAELANRTKSEFLSNMSHELRTPLNAIIGFSEIMQNELFGKMDNRHYEGYAKDIHNSGKFLLDIINDILDMSRLEISKLDLDEDDVDVNRLVESITVMTKSKVEEKRIRLAVAAPKTLPKIRLDSRRMKQVILNLMTNAIKFTPENGKIDIIVEDLINLGLQITVRDSGIGIPKKDQAKVFEAFGKVENSMVRKYEGIGLGLPIVKNMVELHGGTIELVSAENEGTTFIITLPENRVIRGS